MNRLHPTDYRSPRDSQVQLLIGFPLRLLSVVGVEGRKCGKSCLLLQYRVFQPERPGFKNSTRNAL